MATTSVRFGTTRSTMNQTTERETLETPDDDVLGGSFQADFLSTVQKPGRTVRRR